MSTSGLKQRLTQAPETLHGARSSIGVGLSHSLFSSCIAARFQRTAFLSKGVALTAPIAFTKLNDDKKSPSTRALTARISDCFVMSSKLYSAFCINSGFLWMR